MKHLTELFDHYFKKVMKNNDVKLFKKHFPTLYNKVIIPTLEHSYNNMQQWKTLSKENEAFRNEIYKAFGFDPFFQNKKNDEFIIERIKELRK